MRHACLLLVLITLCFRAAAQEAEDDAKIKQAIAALGNNDFKVRNAADLTLRKFGALALPHLRNANSNDPEVKQRLEKLLMLWPPPREKRPMKADPSEIARLYDEYVAEVRRVALVNGMPIEEKKFFGPLESNEAAILSEFKMVMRQDVKNMMDAFMEFRKTREQKFEGNRIVSPDRFLMAGIPADERLNRLRRLARERLLDAVQKQDPPTAEAWKQLRQDVIEAVAEGSHGMVGGSVSMIFDKANLSDVLSTIAKQTSIRLFPEPPELIKPDAEVTVRIEGATWEVALEEVLKPHGLIATMAGQGEGLHIVIRRRQSEK